MNEDVLLNYKERNSNFELLRIIAMLLIVFHHSIFHGVLAYSVTMWQGTPVSDQVWVTTFVGELIAMFGKVAVAVFVMISGYFLVNSSSSWKKSLRKIFSLVIQVYFYSMVIYLVGAHFGWINPKDLNTIRQSFLPFFYNTYWFATEYLLLYLVYPYLNALIHSISREQHRNLILIVSVFSTVVPTIFIHFTNYNSYGNLVMFVLYYIIGGYIRLYTIEDEKKKGLLLTIGSILLMVGVIFWHDYMGRITHNQQYYGNSFAYAEQNSLFVLLVALGTMMFFKHISLGHNKIINTIAATTFGVYLIHDNPIMEQVIWLKWLKMPALLTPNIGHLLIAVGIICPAIFIICSLIDFIRIKLFNWIVSISNRIKKIN